MIPVFAPLAGVFIVIYLVYKTIAFTLWVLFGEPAKNRAKRKTNT